MKLSLIKKRLDIKALYPPIVEDVEKAKKVADAFTILNKIIATKLKSGVSVQGITFSCGIHALNGVLYLAQVSEIIADIFIGKKTMNNSPSWGRELFSKLTLPSDITGTDDEIAKRCEGIFKDPKYNRELLEEWIFKQAIYHSYKGKKHGNVSAMIMISCNVDNEGNTTRALKLLDKVLCEIANTTTKAYHNPNSKNNIKLWVITPEEIEDLVLEKMKVK